MTDILQAALSLRGVYNPEPWPGGFVCPWCGDPWESEPSCTHANAVRQHDREVTTKALHEAAEQLEADGRAEVAWLAKHLDDRLDAARVVGAEDAWKSALGTVQGLIARTDGAGR